ncbi:MAG: NADH-quinone oxidoreductase subunit H [Sandaracinaceae bacterium]
MVLLVVSTVLKILLVIAILLGIAPVLTWLDRRQSAMLQDRVGPHRGGIPLPSWAAYGIRGPLSWGAQAVAWISLALAAAALVRGLVLALEPVGQLAFTLPLFGTFLVGPGELIVLAVVGVLVFAFHRAAAWLMRNLVEGDRLTAFGLVHPAFDAVKMIFKEDFVPPKADKLLYALAPIIALVPAFATFAVIPIGPAVYWGPAGDPFRYLGSVLSAPEAAAAAATVIPLQIANVNVGILFVFAVAGLGIVGAAIAGYSSDNKYALLGGLRAASQMVSYEVTLGLTLVGCFMIYNTLLLDGMVAWQQEHVWGIVVQPVACVMFFFAALAEMKRVPFDAPEGESEIVAGYFLEYSGLKFGMFMTGEYVEHITSSAILVTLFFGGYHVPFLASDGFHFAWLGFDILLYHWVVVLLQVVAFLVKVVLCILLQLQVRWTVPRLRYDQIQQLCWKILLPLSLANIVVTGVVILLLQ